MKKSLVAVVALAMSLSACGQSNNTSTPTLAGANSTYPLTISNSGREVVIPVEPKQIISLSPTATENLFAIEAGSQVLAVDDQSNFPANAPTSELSGFTPSLEAIVALAPDLVVVSNDIDNIVSGLSDVGIPVIVQPAAVTIDDTYLQIAELGAVTNHARQASELIATMRSTIDSALATLSTKTSALTYYHELDNTMYSVTSATFIGSIYASAGLTNIADAAPDASSGYPQLSAEFIVAADPDLIFLGDIKCCGQTAADLGKRPGFAQLTAISQGTVFEIDDDIASRWGPRTADLVTAIVSAVTKAAS